MKERAEISLEPVSDPTYGQYPSRVPSKPENMHPPLAGFAMTHLWEPFQTFTGLICDLNKSLCKRGPGSDAWLGCEVVVWVAPIHLPV